MSNRLFLALWPDNPTRMGLRLAAKSVLVKYPPAGRSVPLDNYHLTLLFLGNDVTPAKEAAARNAVEGVRHAPFEFSLNLASSFKGSEDWWIGSSDASIELMDLRRQLKTRLTAAGLLTDAKRYNPHVTFLTKASQVLPPTHFTPVNWSASEIVLVRSQLSSTGSAYQIVGQWELQGPGRQMEQMGLL